MARVRARRPKGRSTLDVLMPAEELRLRQADPDALADLDATLSSLDRLRIARALHFAAHVGRQAAVEALEIAQRIRRYRTR